MIDPSKRLGCDECGGYPALKAHPFLEGVDWENLHEQKAPVLKPCTVVDGEEIHSEYYVSIMFIARPRLTKGITSRAVHIE